MQTNHILSASLIDIIFDGRNKAYGAYELRSTYEKRIRKALFVTLLAAAIGFGTVVMASTMKKNNSNYRMGPDIVLQSIDEPKKPEDLPKPEKPRPKEPEQPVQTVRLTEPEIVENPETPPQSTDILVKAQIDTDTKAGKEFEGKVTGPKPDDLDDGRGIIEDRTTKETGPAERVDIDAKFDGNWKRFLESNLNAEVPVNNGAPAGRYSVVIRFVVDVDGSISEIQPLTSHGYGLEEEGVRVIKKAKKWEPAFLNGFHVKAYKKQVIVFEVVEE